MNTIVLPLDNGRQAPKPDIFNAAFEVWRSLGSSESLLQVLSLGESWLSGSQSITIYRSICLRVNLSCQVLTEDF